MDPLQLLREISAFGRLTLLVDAIPLVAAAAYVLRPNEVRLALMRPLSLAALFAGAAGTLNGLVSVLAGMAASAGPDMRWGGVYAGLSEALVPAIFGLTCLMVAWLLVAIGIRRGLREG